MARVKRGVMKNKRKSKILRLAKGFRNARSTKYKQAKQGVIRAGQHAFAHRRKKKRVMRKDWQMRINYAVRNLAGISYSSFMDKVHKKGITVDRKIMADMLQNDMSAFARFVSFVTESKVEHTDKA
ncbi:MAG: 50S ribosomal protein L20 [Patescibacteria group bacterium]